ncbi:polysaccharide lyase 8 family protein [Kitasatospora sp. NPDC058397]|uniref:polysaccharide lyase 8 family protein n=1 Tax=unclassified Kitasatospora TaxID=2633591 RepID=UPI00364B7085
MDSSWTKTGDPAAIPVLSRRGLLRTSAAASAAAAAWWLGGPTEARAADNYDAMRAAWSEQLTGTGYDPAAPPFARALTALGDQARSHQAALSPQVGSLWPDLPVGSASAAVTSTVGRLRLMALALTRPATGSTADPGLGAAVTTGLDWVLQRAYTATTTSYGNWWDWQIGAPQALLDVCVLLGDLLTAERAAACGAAVDHFVPSSVVDKYTGTSTGANRVDLCRVLALRGVIGRSAAPVAAAQRGLSPVFRYVTTGDGIYADGSFVQHTWVPYTGSYGEVLLGSLSRLLRLLAGTPWAVTDPALRNVFTAVDRGFLPFLFNGLVMDGVSGRAVSRGVQAGDARRARLDDHVRGHALLGDVLRLADSGSVPAAQAAAWRAAVKGSLQRDQVLPHLSNALADIPELARAQALLADSGTRAADEGTGSRVFTMDRAVHRRPGWSAQLSLSSSRTAFYECGNGENLRAWHSGSGMLYWYGGEQGDEQYSDSFWPTADPYRLPGTTVSTRPLADGAGGDWGQARPATAWAGGASDGDRSVVGQDVRGLGSTLVGRKSWFCLDDSIVCLGAGIGCTDGVAVRTTVDHRNLGAREDREFVLDGVRQPADPGWSRRADGVRWAALAGSGAWVFPDGATLDLARERRTGAWADINRGGAPDPITRTYLSIGLDHGTDPVDGTYHYVLMPGAGPDQAAARAAAPTATVLANTADAQAISAPGLGLTLANFFAPGTVGPLTVSAPCSVLLRENGGDLSVAVADPTRKASTVQLTLALDGYRLASGGTGITVLSDSGPLVLRCAVAGTGGASLSAVFRRSAAFQRGAA